jgi:threonine/homoserine/homoserine lactone efflux protein
MMALIQGSLIAMGAAFGIGPGTALQWKATSQRGMSAGVMAIAGLYASDILLSLSLCFVPAINSIRHIQSSVLPLIGGILLVTLGTLGLFRKIAPVLSMPTSGLSGMIPVNRFFLKGFLLNICNPIAVVFWLGLLSLGGAQFGQCSTGFFIFAGSYIATSITLDMCKCMLFCKVQRVCTGTAFVWANRGMSILLITAGIVVLVK